MQPRHQREDIPAIIHSAFPSRACSVEWRDGRNRISVQVYGSKGEVLFTTEAPARELCIKSILAGRVEHWQAKRHEHLRR